MDTKIDWHGQSNIKIRTRSVLFPQTEKYNKKYPYLLYELCNLDGAKIYFASNVHLDIFWSIYQLKYRIKFYICCENCLMLMNSLDFNRNFKNFTDFKNVRISKILFAMMSWKKSCFRVLLITFFLLVSPLCINVKKVSFASSQKQLSLWIFRMFLETPVEVYS